MNGSVGRVPIWNVHSPLMKALTAITSVWATNFIVRPDRPIASNSTRIRWSDGLEI